MAFLQCLTQRLFHMIGILTYNALDKINNTIVNNNNNNRSAVIIYNILVL